jgi:hypothetical protein
VNPTSEKCVLDAFKRIQKAVSPIDSKYLDLNETSLAAIATLVEEMAKDAKKYRSLK